MALSRLLTEAQKDETGSVAALAAAGPLSREPYDVGIGG
eukprot:CAMPEP_0114510022 /NCGR_PEP_ID=MMETSP0109-20121206/13548_1 /TAXON_ID=29199 /ORGANISM="Chlorarachnion reptans, Strain CCCM449" /LENGTH=38 /DNA_ID= /DNA_START= /DNA_END= /DNA_ORIENTATION=